MPLGRWAGQGSLWATGFSLGKYIPVDDRGTEKTQVVDKLKLCLLVTHIGPWPEQRLCWRQGLNLGYLSLLRQGL